MRSIDIENAPAQDLQSNADIHSASSETNIHAGQFMQVRDSRKRRVSGIYTRNGRYYGLLWADRGDGKKTSRRFPLLKDNDPVRSLVEAKEALEILKNNRRHNALPQAGRKPAFEVFATEYLAMASTLQKRTGTQENEKQAIGRWIAHLGAVRIDLIATPIIKTFIESRLRGCTLAGKTYAAAHPRTVNLDLTALRNVLKSAMDAGHLRDLPRFPVVKTPPPARRPLLTPAEFESLLAGCLTLKKDGQPVSKNGEQLRDFLRLLAFSGAREQEGLRLKWSHVDFEGRRLFIGAPEDFTASGMNIGTGGTSKNRGSRVLDFNPQLETLLLEMRERRAPDCTWLFPSPQRGDKDERAKTFRESLILVRDEMKMPRLGFHDLRHLFCSFCVMAGIDFMTIAAWLGHKDGGILVGKVYGHLLDEHRQKMAARLTIGLAVLPEAQPALQLVKVENMGKCPSHRH
jgi:integrase